MSHVRRIGFTRLGSANPTNGPNQFNIIFVHCLGGHPEYTWGHDPGPTKSAASAFTSLFQQQKSTEGHGRSTAGSSSQWAFWPEEFLTDDIPEATIWTYGYDGCVVESIFQTGSENTISSHGRDLVTQFKRHMDNEYPVIFVAHGFGGIIVKEAIYRSNTIRTPTKYILFLNTPQRREKRRGWTAAACKLADSALQDSMSRKNRKILESLRVDGRMLDKIQSRFEAIALEQGIKVSSFQERKCASGVSLYMYHTEVASSSTSETKLSDAQQTVAGSHADHRQIAKFEKRSDAGYREIRSALQAFIRKIPTSSTQLEPISTAPSTAPAQTLSITYPYQDQAEDTTASQPTLPLSLNYQSSRGELSTNTPRSRPVVHGTSRNIPLRRPATRQGFEIAIICALTLEADAVEALFDQIWDTNDKNSPYDKAPNDSNTYTTGFLGRHPVVLAYLPGMGKASAAAAAASFRMSFQNIRLALVVGICGVVPVSPDDDEILLGDVIISEYVIQYDFGARLPGKFLRKEGVRDILGRSNPEIRGLLAKLKGRQGQKSLREKISQYLEILQANEDLASKYRMAKYDRLFEATYRHVNERESCDRCGCDTSFLQRTRVRTATDRPRVYIGPIASGDTVMKSALDRDMIAGQDKIIAFEMEGSGVWDNIPCVVVKGACDYADSHKNKTWQPYAAATAAACAKAFLDSWVPSQSSQQESFQRWFIVPYPRSRNFVGREEIMKQLQRPPRPGAQSRLALIGLGGIGKTNIVLEYAYRIYEMSELTSVFWVHGSSAERFRESYSSIAYECQIPEHADPAADILLIVKEWLESKHHDQWLMIIDNADDKQVFSSPSITIRSESGSKSQVPLTYYIPKCAHGSILITSRDRAAGVELAEGAPLIEINVMSEEESKLLIRANIGEGNVTGYSLGVLSSRLEHLPLALAQAAAFMEAKSMSVAEYTSLLDGTDVDPIELLGDDYESFGKGIRASRAMVETWIISFEMIRQQDPYASDLLSRMAFFDRQAIPREFLAYDEKNAGQEIDERVLTSALGTLKRFSFISTGKDQTFDMHRLVQLVSQKWLIRDRMAERFAIEALRAVSYVFPEATYENWATCSKYLAHATAVLRSVKPGKRQIRRDRVQVLDKIASYFEIVGEWKSAEEYLIEARRLTADIKGQGHLDTLVYTARLASTYWNQGRWDEAETLEVQVLERMKKKLGADHPDTLTIMGNLASTYWNQGRWDEAETLDVQVLERRMKKLGADHPDTLASMGNLASTYRNQGRWDEAETLEVQVLESRKKKLGADHPDTLTIMSNLASTYWNQGRWDEAENLHLQVLESRKKKFGADHPDTLTSMGNLASTYRDQGRCDEAENLHLQVLESRKIKLGADHPNTLSSMANLASTYCNQGRWDEAEALDAQVLESRKMKLGADHPDTLATMSSLASMLQRRGQLSGAIELMTACVTARRRVLGPHHRSTLWASQQLEMWGKLSQNS